MRAVYVLFPLTVIFFSLFTVAYSHDYYLSHSSEVEYYEEEVGNILQYFQGGELNEERYSEEEVIHLKDVRNLFYFGLVLTLILFSFTIWSLSKVSSKEKKEVYLKVGAYSCGVFLGLGLVLWLAFSYVFNLFHQVLFLNDYWLLPSEATLIQMFPESFFASAGSSIILYSIMFSLLIIVAGLIIPGRRKKDGRT